MKLTQRTVDGLRPPDGKSEVLCFDDDIPGFGIRVGAKRRSWIVQWQSGAKQRRMTIGHTGMMSAVKARDTAKDILARVRLGEDPQADKYAARGAVTMGNLLPSYLANKRGRGRSVRTLKEMERYLTKYASPLHGLAIAR